MSIPDAARAALPHDAAVAEMLQNAGSQFDAKIVQALLTIVAPWASTHAADGAGAPDQQGAGQRVLAGPR